VREYLESHADCSLDLVDEDGLQSLVSLMADDRKFLNQELHRLENILSTVGNKFGGQKFEHLDQEVCVNLCYNRLVCIGFVYV
jgi:hypothetical protein